MKEKGLYGKYIITRADGKPIDPENEYFVLKIEGKGDKEHIEACRRAILVYADEIEEHLPELANDIYNKFDYTKCECCEKKLFIEDEIVRDSEGTPLCRECYEELKDDMMAYEE